MTLRVGFIGCGFIASAHSRAVRALAEAGMVDIAVVATCDLDRDRAEAFARAHRAPLATTDPAEVLAAVDAVFVCTPTSSHRPLVEAAAGAGVAVFCEKPLATNLACAEAMAAAVIAAGVAHRVGLVLRTAPAYVALADMVGSGVLGRPMAAVFRDDQYLPTQGQYASTWRGDVAVAGGGTLLEHSIHDLDLLAWVLGEVDSVSARTAGFAGLTGIEDVAVATLSFASGATASLTSVWHQVLARPSTRSLEILCEHGIVAVGHEFEGPLNITTDAGAGPSVGGSGPSAGGTEVRPTPAPSWVGRLPLSERWRAFSGHYAPQALQFLLAASGEEATGPGLDDAITAHRLAEAAYESAAVSGAPVGTAVGALSLSESCARIAR